MTETVTGYKMGLYIVEQRFEVKTGHAYNIDKYGLDDVIVYTKIVGVFTTLQNAKLAMEKILINTKIKEKDLAYRLVPKDQLLIDLPSTSENPEDVYSW